MHQDKAKSSTFIFPLNYFSCFFFLLGCTEFASTHMTLQFGFVLRWWCNGQGSWTWGYWNGAPKLSPFSWQAGPSVGCPVLAVLSHELGAHPHELTLAMTGKIMWTILDRYHQVYRNMSRKVVWSYHGASIHTNLVQLGEWYSWKLVAYQARGGG